MKVISIVIRLEPEGEAEQAHARTLTYANGMWAVDGALYNRISGVMHGLVDMLYGKSPERKK